MQIELKMESEACVRVFILAIAFILISIFHNSNAIIFPPQEQIHRRNTYHTCISNEECMERLSASWPSYNFVCCTTMVCDENYGNYYLVRSGCAPQQHCAPEVREGTKFAARFERRIFDALGGPSLENNCIRTRQQFSNRSISSNAFLERESFSSATTTRLASKTTALNKYPARTATPIKCPCKDHSKCCIHVSCIDGLQADISSYDLQVECIEQCSLVNIRIHSEYEFYFPLKTWDERLKYERQKIAPPTEGTCRETRFFYDWYIGKREGSVR